MYRNRMKNDIKNLEFPTLYIFKPRAGKFRAGNSKFFVFLYHIFLYTLSSRCLGNYISSECLLMSLNTYCYNNLAVIENHKKERK